VEFRILGTLEVLDAEGADVAPSGRRARGLLALLLLHANETITVERVIDGLWGEEPPASARKVVQNLVSELRRTLGERLETRGGGYRLDVKPGELDLDRFQAGVREASRLRTAGDVLAAADALREALALWRGPPLAELGYERFGAQASQLEELHLSALEERIDADLALGRDSELTSEIERLIAEEPLRERLRVQLMLALYRSGRQAEALAAYRDARTVLVEELGLEPGDELQRLEQAILRHDPGLTPPPAAAATVPAPSRHPPSPWRRPRTLAAAGLLVLLAAAGVAVLEVSRSPGRRTVPPNSVALLDAGSGRLLAAIPVGSRPIAVAVGAGAVWVANADAGTVSRVDPRTRRVVETIGTGAAASDIAVGGGAVWLASGSEGVLLRIDPHTNTVVRKINLSGPDKLAPEGVYSVVTGGGAVWVGSGSGAVLKIDPATDRVAERFSVGMTPVDIAFGAGNLWLVHMGGRILRIDPASGEVTGTVEAAPNARAIAVGEDGVWVTDVDYDQGGRGIVWRIDPVTATFSGEMTKLAGPPMGVATGGGAVWVAGGLSGTVIEIDPHSGGVRSIALGNAPLDVAYGDGELWVTVGATNAAAS
jgi:DNA-binding SARP family transcriptional activator/DNA-binding beta-propeller fold protein YncE